MRVLNNNEMQVINCSGSRHALACAGGLASMGGAIVGVLACAGAVSIAPITGGASLIFAVAWLSGGVTAGIECAKALQ